MSENNLSIKKVISKRLTSLIKFNSIMMIFYKARKLFIQLLKMKMSKYKSNK